jgi:hypothetical protein
VYRHVNELPTSGGALGIVRAMESETLDNFKEGLINVRTSFLDRAGFSTEDARQAGLTSAHCRMSFDTTNEAVARKFASEILTGLGAEVRVDDGKGRILIRNTHLLRFSV